MAGLRCAINCSAATGWNSLRESRPGATCGSAVARDCRPLALYPARTPRVATSRSRSSGVAREHRCQLGGQSCIVQQQRLVGPQARKAKADAGAFRCRSVRPSHHPAPACRLPHGSTNVYRSSRIRRLWKCHWPDYPLGGGFMPHPLRRWRLTHPPRYADQHPHHAHRRTWKNQRAHLVALRDLESGVANGIRTRNNQNHNLGHYH